MRVIGLMSGTSVDGIDAALVVIKGSGKKTQLELIAFDTYPYSVEIRKRIFELFEPATKREIAPGSEPFAPGSEPFAPGSEPFAPGSEPFALAAELPSGSMPSAPAVNKICQMNFLLGELFAEACLKIIKKAGLSPEEVDLIGSHGQTICHLPDNSSGNIRSTLQIGEPAVIAERTGITTVADFRVRDIAAGGMGAPLVPYADYLLLTSPTKTKTKTKTRAIQNIGGIANVTILPANSELSEIIAFDTGPGNMVIDGLSRILFDQPYDQAGKLAAQGVLSRELLACLMKHPFLAQAPPKTTGREEFGVEFVNQVINWAQGLKLSPVDILATTTAFTARTISHSYTKFILPKFDLQEVVVSGGGSHNLTLLTYLKEYLHPIPVVVIDDLGIPADAKEAISFALLAKETIAGVPNNVPSATGASRPVILGKIIPGKKGLWQQQFSFWALLRLVGISN